jgi:hypothetical protein
MIYPECKRKKKLINILFPYNLLNISFLDNHENSFVLFFDFTETMKRNNSLQVACCCDRYIHIPSNIIICKCIKIGIFDPFRGFLSIREIAVEEIVEDTGREGWLLVFHVGKRI